MLSIFPGQYANDRNEVQLRNYADYLRESDGNTRGHGRVVEQVSDYCRQSIEAILHKQLASQRNSESAIEDAGRAAADTRKVGSA